LKWEKILEILLRNQWIDIGTMRNQETNDL
jgi:hypothetical protein